MSFAGESERIEQEMDVSIYGVGVSLVNNDMDVRRELAYLGVTSSSIVWEVRREGKQRYKSLTTAQCQVGSSLAFNLEIMGARTGVWSGYSSVSEFTVIVSGSNIFVRHIFVPKSQCSAFTGTQQK